MKCENHPRNKATEVCAVCGKHVCPKCITNVKGRNNCYDCLSKRSDFEKYINKTDSAPKLYERKQKNEYITFLCAFIPGIGQMYLGYKKRGFIFFILFVLCLLLRITSYFGIIIWLFTFFDTFKLKEAVLRNTNKQDNIDDVKILISRNKWILLLAVALSFFVTYFEPIKSYLINLKASITSHFSDRAIYISSVISVIFLFLFISFLIYLKFRKKQKNKDK